MRLMVLTAWLSALLFFALALLSYAFFRSWQAYRRRRDGHRFLKVAVVFVALLGVWLELYGAPFETVLTQYRVLLAFVPLVLFLAYDRLAPSSSVAGHSLGGGTDFLEAYVSPHVVSQIRQKGYVTLGGTHREVTVLVTDVRNSTGMCVTYPPDVVLKSLNRYFEVVTDAVTHHGGTLDKLTGDGVMAVFNAPRDLPDHASKAYAAACDIQQRMVKVNHELSAEHLPVLNVGVGLDFGVGVLGNIGSKHLVRYTVIGDVANTASRIQEFAKGGQVALTPAAFRALGGREKVDAKGENVQVKGKGMMTIYKVSVA